MIFSVLLRAVTNIYFPIRLLLDSNNDIISKSEVCNKKNQNESICLFQY